MNRFMAKQFQLRSRSISIDDLELAHTIQNGCEWYVEQQGHHQVHTREVTAFQLESIAEYSGTHNPPLFGSLASDTWHIGTILEWILMALLSDDRQEFRCAFSPQPSSIHAFSHHGKQEE